MATYSSILAWRIPQTKEPGGLQSMASQRVRHDWATNTHTTHTQNGIWRCSLWGTEWNVSRRCDSHDGTSTFTRKGKGKKLCVSFWYRRIVRRQKSVSWRVLSTTWYCWLPDFMTITSRTVREFFSSLIRASLVPSPPLFIVFCYNSLNGIRHMLSLYSAVIQFFSSVRIFETAWTAVAKLPCPSPFPRDCSNSCPLSRWCNTTISSSVVTFSSCLQSFPA